MIRKIAGIVILVVLAWRGEAESIRYWEAREAPKPRSMRADVRVDGRTGEPIRIDVVKVQKRPDWEGITSGEFVTEQEGFSWYVTRHYAMKTDVGDAEAKEALVLLELEWVMLCGIFGEREEEPIRMVIVYGSSRDKIKQAGAHDGMHSFLFGGVTQEGFGAAYLYAGAPYQTRYILLHEAVHLFQYRLTGNVRSSYGFFLEGVADYVSSHVYEPDRRRLTVCVLDRAPIHNHFAKGVEEWKRFGRPSFGELYKNAKISRGLSVLLTAFLQSTPEYERKWRIYCKKMVEESEKSPKEQSDRWIKELYGDLGEIDRKFQKWVVALNPSYALLGRDFDQEGEAFVSAAPASMKMPAKLALPRLRMGGWGDFVRDWPRERAMVTDALYKIDIRWGGEMEANRYAAVRFKGKEEYFSCVISNAPNAGVAFFEVGGRRDPQMGNRKFPGQLREGVSIEVRKGKREGEVEVWLIGKENRLARFSVRLPRGEGVGTFLEEVRPIIEAAAEGVWFRPYETEKVVEKERQGRLKAGARFETEEEGETEERRGKREEAREGKEGEKIALENWRILGPFSVEDRRMQGILEGGESEIDFEKSHELMDGTFTFWERAPIRKTPLATSAVVHLAGGLKRQANHSVVYAVAEWESEEEGEKRLRLGVTDGVEANLNGKKVRMVGRYGEEVNAETIREWSDRNTEAKIWVRKGKNQLLLRLVHGEGVWLLSGLVESFTYPKR